MHAGEVIHWACAPQGRLGWTGKGTELEGMKARVVRRLCSSSRAQQQSGVARAHVCVCVCLCACVCVCPLYLAYAHQGRGVS